MEERLFSILMTEEEVSAFSEFLEQKEFARGIGRPAVSSAKEMIRRGGLKKINKAAKRAREIKKSGIPMYKSEGSKTVKTSPDEVKTAIMRVRRDLLESTFPGGGGEKPWKHQFHNVNQRINLRDYYTTENFRRSPEFHPKKKNQFATDHKDFMFGDKKLLYKGYDIIPDYSKEYWEEFFKYKKKK